MVVYSLLSPWLWGAPKTVVHLGLTSTCLHFLASPHPRLFPLRARTLLDIIWAPTSGRLVKAWWCVLAEMWVCRLDLRRTGLVGVVHLRRICPLFSLPALRFRPPLCTLCCCCMRWTPKREWNGRFGAQVTENLSFRVRPLVATLGCRVSVSGRFPWRVHNYFL